MARLRFLLVDRPWVVLIAVTVTLIAAAAARGEVRVTVATSPAEALAMVNGAWDKIASGEVRVIFAAESPGLPPDPVDPDPVDPAPPVVDPVPPVVPGTMAVGMNLAGVTYWTREWPWVDAMRTASHDHPASGGWRVEPDGRPLPCDARGYPIGLPSGVAVTALTMRATGGHYPGGEYDLIFEGRGVVRLMFDASGEWRHGGAGEFRQKVRVTPSDDGVLVVIAESDPTNHVRNIRLIMPGFGDTYQAQPFHPLFLERLRPFKVLRFMDWQHTNDSNATTWNGRTREDYRTQSMPQGVAVEWMIRLANELDVDPWFCMPHRADDDYVRQFARLVEEKLEPGRKVYVEWSNEFWNYIFEQARWCQSVADSRTPRVRAVDVAGEEAGRDFRIWKEVFVDEPERLVCVAAGQHYGPWIAAALMDALRGVADAVSCGAYFYAHGMTVDWTTDELLDALADDIDGPHYGPFLDRHAEIAEAHGVPLLVYEGGQHLAGSPAATAANRDPRMGDLYRRALERAREAGVDVYCAFSYVVASSQWGSWGTLEWQDQPVADAPKYRAVRDAAEGR